MYKHLFLEGPVQEGKSTLLRNVLAPYKNSLGGFASQRLLTPDGRTAAFRIGAAASTPLTAPITDETAGGLDGVFRINSRGKALKFPEVFDTDGVRYLTGNEGKKIILLDEIGGAEMLSSPFRTSLYTLLSGSIPCIGVIKRKSSAAFMSRTAGYENSVLKHNIMLRDAITGRYNGRILYFERGDGSVKKELEDFLCGVFMTE